MTTELGVTESFALAILDPRSGRRVIDGTHWKAGLAGAAVIDLVRARALRLAQPGDPIGRSGRFVATGDGLLSGPGWAEVLRRADGQTPKNAIARIGGGSSWTDRADALWADVAAGLVEKGIVRRDEERILGLFPSTRWRVTDESTRDRLLARVRATLADAATADELVGAVTALLHATDVLPKVFPNEPKKWLKAQGRVVSQGVWASDAVRRAIADVQAAATAAVTVATSAAVISST